MTVNKGLTLVIRDLKKKSRSTISMKGGSGGQKQFEVTPIGETGGSIDAETSNINARLIQLGAEQAENSKFEINLDKSDGAFNLGSTVGGGKKRRVKKSLKKKSRNSNKQTHSKKGGKKNS